MQVYLDNSATTKPSEYVIDAMSQSMREGYHNPSALYSSAMYAERDMVEACREIAKSLHANEKNVIFTSGGTESNNLAIMGHMQSHHEKGEILYSAAEHPAVKNTCMEAEKRFGCAAKEIPLLPNGSIDLDAFEAMLSPIVQMICVMQVSNETGVIMPIDEVCKLRDRLAPKAAIHVDGVQGYAREPFSMKQLSVQSYALSGHKINGPKGVGALVFQNGLRIVPQLFGGGQQGNIRSGTENTTGIAGLRAAVMHYPKDGAAHMRSLKVKLHELLTAALAETTVIGLPVDDKNSAGHILSVAFPPVRAETLLHALEGDGICVGTGSACSSKKGKRSVVLTAMKQSPEVMDSAIRISFCPSNTQEEMIYTADQIIKHVQMLRKFKRR
ncbi:MAG: cysteine desulfurase [Clostridiales bacterium]|nr:cysteine desulfurase [Clostridiales bacterium]